MHSKKSRKRTSVKPPSAPLPRHPERTSRTSGWAPRSHDAESGEREITARPKGPGEMPHSSGVIESGLSVDPEDLGREFLAHATDQDNFESLAASHDGAVELDEPAADDAIPFGASSDDPELWGRTIDVVVEEDEIDETDPLADFDTRDGIADLGADFIDSLEDDDDADEEEDIEDDDIAELGTVGVIGNLGEDGDGDVEGYIDLDDDQLIEVISVEHLDVLTLLTVVELEALGPSDEAAEAERAAEQRSQRESRPRSMPPAIPRDPPPKSGRGKR